MRFAVFLAPLFSQMIGKLYPEEETRRGSCMTGSCGSSCGSGCGGGCGGCGGD